jgi:hypothetical protein
MLKEVTEGALMLCLIAVALTLARTDVCLTACSSEKKKRSSLLPAVNASEAVTLTRYSTVWPDH